MADDNWKSKYFEALEEFERKEQQWDESEQALRRGLGRVALAAQGVDRSLDKRLKSLRKALQKSGNIEYVSELIDEVSDRLKILDEQEASRGPDSAPHVLLDHLVGALEFPFPYAEQASKFKDEIKACQDTHTLHALIDEFADFVSVTLRSRLEPLAETPEQEVPPEKRPGFVGRLLSRQERQEARGLASPAQPLTPSPKQEGETARCVEDLFLDLLECMAFPSQFNDRVQQIKERLVDGVGSDGVREITQQVVTLMVDLRNTLENEREELERFLQQLLQRLQELDAIAVGAESNVQAAFISGRQLDQAVTAQVNDIENAVHTVGDAQQMKSIIQGSLESIRRHLELQRNEEAKREQELESQLEVLSQHLRNLEDESHVLRQRLEKERAQALTDPLTGAPNRLAFDQRIAQEFARWQRYGSPLSLILFDVDHFKRINDNYGHAAGDKALIAIVQMLMQRLRTSDILARIGGEEFAVILPETMVEDAFNVAEKMRIHVESCAFAYRGSPVPITLSAGVAQFDGDDSVESVYRRADAALYQAKNSGRNQSCKGE